MPPARLERATHSLEGCCSIQLSYESVKRTNENLSGCGRFSQILSAGNFFDEREHLIEDFGQIEFAGVYDERVVGDGERRIFA